MPNIIDFYKRGMNLQLKFFLFVKCSRIMNLHSLPTNHVSGADPVCSPTANFYPNQVGL